MPSDVLEVLKNEKKKKKHQENKREAEAGWSSCRGMKLSSYEGRKQIWASGTYCTTPSWNTRCVCGHLGPPCPTGTRGTCGLSQAMATLVTAAVSFLLFCHSSDLPAGLPRHQLQSTMLLQALHFSSPPLPSCTTRNGQRVSACPAWIRLLLSNKRT